MVYTSIINQLIAQNSDSSPIAIKAKEEMAKIYKLDYETKAIKRQTEYIKQNNQIPPVPVNYVKLLNTY